MRLFKYVIIGGGVAGTTAAETLRGLEPGASICLVSDEPYTFYSRIALSKENYMLKEMPEEKIVFLKTDKWYEDKKVALLKGATATGLDAKAKTVPLSNGETLEYEKLLIAVGGTPRRWAIPGSDKKGVYYLRTLDEARAIIAEFKKSKAPLFIGGGFITFELCDIAVKRSIVPTVLIREPYYWANLLDEESGRVIEDYLQKANVKIIWGEEAVEVISESHGDHVDGVKTNKGRKILCDFIVVGIGIMDRMGPFRASGLQVAKGILTDASMKTNLPDVWAAGDCAEYQDLILNDRVQLGNWANAMMHGRVAAHNMFGRPMEYRMLSAYTTQGLGLSICFVGDVRGIAGREVIARGSRASGKYSRIILNQNRVVGATMLNMTPELPWITKLITDQRDVSALKSQLADSAADLRALAVAKASPA